MVYTVTFHPSVDYIVHTDKLAIGSVNSGKNEKICFGGKGINVSIILNELGISTKALGFVAGLTGETIEKGIAEKGIETDFVHLDNGFSTINVKIISDSVAESDGEHPINEKRKPDNEACINGQEPVIDDKAFGEFFRKLDSLSDGDTIVLSGSIPEGMPPDTYEKILEYLSGKNIKAVVDAEGDLLLNILKYKPFLVRINSNSLAETFDALIRNNDEILEYAGVLRRMGARNVLVSSGSCGAVLLDENGKDYLCNGCIGTLKNYVGAGDSLVAGVIAGAQKGDYRYALKLGNAAAGATLFSDGLAQKEEIFRQLDQLEHMKYWWT